jgi:hypothetical protein
MVDRLHEAHLIDRQTARRRLHDDSRSEEEKEVEEEEKENIGGRASCGSSKMSFSSIHHKPFSCHWRRFGGHSVASSTAQRSELGARNTTGWIYPLSSGHGHGRQDSSYVGILETDARIWAQKGSFFSRLKSHNFMTFSALPPFHISKVID